MRSSTALEGKVALVTGGARRIGGALSLGLAAAGADVAIHHHASPEHAGEVKARIEKLGRRAWVVQEDFREPGGGAAAVAGAVDAAGRLDLLVNNAGIYPQATLPDTTPETMTTTLAVNTWAPLDASRAFAARAADGGSIVNVLDTHLHRLTREKFAYQLSKQALAWVTRATALEFAPRLRVNGVAPGAILPPPDADEPYLDQLGATLPLRRHGGPQDVLDAVLFLATAPFVTGVVIEVDGGEHLQGRRDDA